MSFFENKHTGLFYGSDTGNTEEITNKIVDLWKLSSLEVIDGYNMSVEDYERFDFIMIGLSTWYDGELQSDFDSFYEQFKTIDFSGKTIALFGVGDQVDYAEYFVDGLGILAEVIIENGGQIIGLWSTEGYDFDESKGLYNEDFFYGLALDFENQQDLNDSRVEAWLQQLEQEVEELVEA